jgi:hypothetical protein
MFKNIVPKLISLDTNLRCIKGLHISQDLNFFESTGEKNRFHYKITLKNDVEIPTNYDFRNEYYIKKGRCWYYKRKVLFWYLKFEYNIEKKKFCFSKLYSFLPFRIGDILPIGGHITTMIILDLFLAGFIYGRGIATQIENKNICFFAPGFNGKTVFLTECLKRGAKYIAEDILIIDIKKKEVYPTCPFLKYNFFQRRKVNKMLKKNIISNAILNDSVQIDKLNLFQNSLSLSYQPERKECFDFFLLNSLNFFYNSFIRSYIFEEGLNKTFFEQILNLKNTNMNDSFYVVRNFNINSIFKKYGKQK